MICDFCNADGAITTFDCADHTLLIAIALERETEHRSIGPWAACADCAGDVRADNRDALVERAFTQAGLIVESEQFSRLLIRTLHAGFFEHRLPGRGGR